MWPLYIVSLFGWFLLINYFVNHGNNGKNSLSITLRSKNFTGNLRDTWWNCTRHFFVVSDRMTALYVGRREFVGLSSERFTVHISFTCAGLQRPTMMIVLYVLHMTRRYWEKVVLQSWSHSCPMDSITVVCISGNRCQVQALGGNVGILREQMCVDDISSPLGRSILISMGVGLSCRSFALA